MGVCGFEELSFITLFMSASVQEIKVHNSRRASIIIECKRTEVRWRRAKKRTSQMASTKELINFVRETNGSSDHILMVES